jgi:hypothetical protein
LTATVVKIVPFHGFWQSQGPVIDGEPAPVDEAIRLLVRLACDTTFCATPVFFME